jgi:hypothetical protein
MPRASTRPRVPKIKVVVERERGPFNSRLMSLMLASGGRINTPAFIPSFSSVVTPRWLTTAKALRAGAASKGLVLVSAKDVEESAVRQLPGFAGIVLDSGGYETRRQRKPWSPQRYRAVCAKFRADIVVGFDADEDAAPPLPQQVSRQVRAFAAVPRSALRVLLLHVDPREVSPRDLARALQRSATEWDVLGVVDRDLGLALSDRVRGIRLVRDALDAAALYRPIHVFGAGDPFAISMYALAGADLFDALSWSTGFVDVGSMQLLPMEAHEFSAGWRSFADARGGASSDAVRRGLILEWNIEEFARLCALLQMAVLHPSELGRLDFLRPRRADLASMRVILGESEVDAVAAYFEART